ncbi:LPS assembly lipoprotein LptE [Noviherbaspirillum sp. CPCC 100848]|uniref:LPS-assembly lipoprotein LptE n=1 Tax=Noviherbaspirillum album TaxID=3080276 RepID=A0ABU6J9E8_9BURK|nr:LPS assembly lipoprotein LptE [Noviherbaspirillum sp. CPCC 100848]MEC4720275.1 LPS assembly lipoprotein LptE [Noviherbaspirillum sp. CPCC 100848]
MQRRSLVLALSGAALLSACGFRLRGADGKSGLPFRTVYIGVPERSPLGVELKRYIRASEDTTIVAEPKEAEAVIEILSETRDRATLSLNTQGRVREYSLYYRLTFQVKNAAGGVLLAPTELVLKRDISFNESQVIAKEKEEDMLYRDMQSDAVQQILRRMSALKPA